MSHPDPKHDPENVYKHDSAPARAIKKKMGKKQSTVQDRQRRLRGQLTDVKGESPLAKLKRLMS